MPCIFPEKDMSRRGVPAGSIGNLAAVACGEEKDPAYAIEARRRTRCERDEQERTRRCSRGKAECHNPPVGPSAYRLITVRDGSRSRFNRWTIVRARSARAAE